MQSVSTFSQFSRLYHTPCSFGPRVFPGGGCVPNAPHKLRPGKATQNPHHCSCLKTPLFSWLVIFARLEPALPCSSGPRDPKRPNPSLEISPDAYELEAGTPYCAGTCAGEPRVTLQPLPSGFPSLRLGLSQFGDWQTSLHWGSITPIRRGVIPPRCTLEVPRCIQVCATVQRMWSNFCSRVVVGEAPSPPAQDLGIITRPCTGFAGGGLSITLPPALGSCSPDQSLLILWL